MEQDEEKTILRRDSPRIHYWDLSSDCGIIYWQTIFDYRCIETFDELRIAVEYVQEMVRQQNFLETAEQDQRHDYTRRTLTTMQRNLQQVIKEQKEPVMD